jgi:hypothetical protein
MHYWPGPDAKEREEMHAKERDEMRPGFRQRDSIDEPPPGVRTYWPTGPDAKERDEMHAKERDEMRPGFRQRDSIDETRVVFGQRDSIDGPPPGLGQNAKEKAPLSDAAKAIGDSFIKPDPVKSGPVPAASDGLFAKSGPGVGQDMNTPSALGKDIEDMIAKGGMQAGNASANTPTVNVTVHLDGATLESKGRDKGVEMDMC